MTIAQVMAILGLLTAFNVQQPIINNVSDILMAKVATTTAASAPIVEATTTVQVSPEGNVTPAPTFGATQQNVQADAPVSKAAINVIRIDTPEQSASKAWAFVVSVTDDSGKTILHAPITMTAPEFTSSQDTNTQLGSDLGNWRTTFGYSPTQKGTQTITFTSGELTKSITIDVL